MVQTQDSTWGRILRYNIHQLLDERGWSPADLYSQAGMCRRGYSALFKSKSGPYLATIERLASVLGVKTTDLLRPIPEEEDDHG